MVSSLPHRIFRRFIKPGPWRRWTSAARALPDFLIIGAMRSGTTSLYDLICRHPRVVPAIRKEIHYFDLYHSQGLAWYRAHFPRAEALQQVGGITGEASPYYIYHPLAPGRAAGSVPGARIIAILRHPVDRAYSHYWHSVHLREEVRAFEEAIERESDRLAGEELRMVREPQAVSRPHLRFSYLSRSIYADQLSRWLEHYPREQLLVLEHDAFFGDPDTHSASLFAFLDLEPHRTEPPREINRASYPPMAAGTRSRLVESMAPHNQRLFDLIGESFDWQH